MKTFKYIFLLFCLIATVACFEDETTLDTTIISEISIDTTKIQKVYNIDYNDTLTISIADKVSETQEQLPLKYCWEVNYKVYSESETLQFVGSKLGSHPARIKVSNEHGSCFYQFIINVKTAYETGIAILSETNEGVPMFSFMRELSDKDVTEGKRRKFVNNCLAASNPDIVFPSNPTDCSVYENNLYISFSDAPAIYKFNSKLLSLEGIEENPNDPDFIPTEIKHVTEFPSPGVVLTTGGKAYQFGQQQGVTIPHPSLFSTYSKAMVYAAGYSLATILWDNKDNAIVNFDGYSVSTTNDPYYYIDFNEHEFITFFQKDANNFITLTKKNGKIMKTTLPYSWYNFSPEMPTIIEGDTDFNTHTPHVTSPKQGCLYYALGNKIYQWFFATQAFPTKPWKILNEIPNTEVTALSISEDEEQLYVGVNDNSKNELSGSFYLLNSDTGKNEGDSPYLNIAHKPVRIMYKK